MKIAVYIAEDSLGSDIQPCYNLEGFSSQRITQRIQFLSNLCVCVRACVAPVFPHVSHVYDSSCIYGISAGTNSRLVHLPQG